MKKLPTVRQSDTPVHLPVFKADTSYFEMKSGVTVKFNAVPCNRLYSPSQIAGGK